MVELEEKEEAGCYTAKKEEAHVSPLCDAMFRTIWRRCSWFALSCVYSAVRGSYFLVSWSVCCYKATNFLDWVLDTDWELLTVETLWAARRFSAVVLESPYTRFLSGSPDDLTSIHKSKSKSGWVEGSSPYLSLNRLL